MPDEVRIDWGHHQAELIVSGQSVAAYARQHGLNTNTARKNLKAAAGAGVRQSIPTSGRSVRKTKKFARKGADARRSALLEQIKGVMAKSISDDKVELLERSLMEYAVYSGDNIMLLQRQLASFRGELTSTDPDYVAPAQKEDGSKISPLPELTRHAKVRLDTIGDAVRTLSQVTESRSKMALATAKEMRIEHRRLDDIEAIDERNSVISQALTNFQNPDEPWSASRAASFIESHGHPLPAIILAALKLEEFSDGHHAEPMTEEQLEAEAIDGIRQEEEWQAMLVERRKAEMIRREFDAENGEDPMLIGAPLNPGEQKYEFDDVGMGAECEVTTVYDPKTFGVGYTGDDEVNDNEQG